MSVCLSQGTRAANSLAYLSRQASSAALSVTVSDPLATAAAITCTSELITTVPVRELMITRAGGVAGSISMPSKVET